MPKVLVIDDEAGVRDTIERTLLRAGCELVLAEDGRRGVALFQREAPDLTITDIIMPEGEGIETIRAIRKLQPAAKIIAMSGGGMISSADLLYLATRFGACEVIAKPFDPDDLTARVARCLAEG